MQGDCPEPPLGSDLSPAATSAPRARQCQLIFNDAHLLDISQSVVFLARLFVTCNVAPGTTPLWMLAASGASVWMQEVTLTGGHHTDTFGMNLKFGIPQPCQPCHPC
jgi:hypothetical protein